MTLKFTKSKAGSFLESSSRKTATFFVFWLSFGKGSGSVSNVKGFTALELKYLVPCAASNIHSVANVQDQFTCKAIISITALFGGSEENEKINDQRGCVLAQKK